MNKNLEKLPMIERIDWLCRFVLIHSILYYDYNTNIISDKVYDEYCITLAKLIKENPLDFSKCFYYNVFKNFDGTTGFDLKSKLTKDHLEFLQNVACSVRDNYITYNPKPKDKKVIDKKK